MIPTRAMTSALRKEGNAQYHMLQHFKNINKKLYTHNFQAGILRRQIYIEP
jgi:hypothetical protein